MSKPSHPDWPGTAKAPGDRRFHPAPKKESACCSGFVFRGQDSVAEEIIGELQALFTRHNAGLL